MLKPDMEKYNFLHEPKIFHPKKCVNYNKSNLQQNSVKGPKDPNGAFLFSKSNIKFQNLSKNSTKNSKSLHFLLSQQNSTHFAEILPDIVFFCHQHCFHISMFFHLSSKHLWQNCNKTCRRKI